MRKSILIFSIVFLAIGSVFANISPNQMVNIAGKQRMLSQKIAKIYLMKAYGANLPELNSELNISKIIFERNLETLSVNSEKMFSDKVTKAVLKEKVCWNEFKQFIDKPANENSIDRVLNLSNILLKNSDEVVGVIKKENLYEKNFNTNTKLINIIDKSGKQRMLSQRLCLYFIAKKFNLKNKVRSLRNDTTLYSVYNELDEELMNLLNSEVNSFEVDNAIGSTMLTFENLRSQKNTIINGTASLNLVYSTSNKLTKDFDNLTSKYVELKSQQNHFASTTR